MAKGQVSLWLVPKDGDGQKLKTLVNALHTTHGLDANSYPLIEPHVTLASIPEDTIEKVKEVLRGIYPPNVPFSSIQIGNEYFKSVYIAVDPTSELLDLHCRFNKTVKPAFPHVSLCYISDEDAQRGERQKFYDELNQAGKIRQSEKGIELKCGETWLGAYRTAEVWLVRCVGPVDQWDVLDKIVLA